MLTSLRKPETVRVISAQYLSESKGGLAAEERVQEG
jgi:hypothetical protein